jgi:hypothetical protein
MTRKQLRDFIVFWEKLPDRAYQRGPAKDEWVAGLRARVGAVPDSQMEALTEFWRRRYADLEGDRTSSTARGNALLGLVGVITAATTLIIGSAAQSALPWQVALFAIGTLLLAALTATVWLAIRVQQVGDWDEPYIEPEDALSSRNLRVKEAVEFWAAAEQNRTRINNVIGYLRDAQRWALVAIALLVLLAPVSVVASATKPSQAGTAPAPTTQPTSTTSRTTQSLQTP